MNHAKHNTTIVSGIKIKAHFGIKLELSCPCNGALDEEVHIQSRNVGAQHLKFFSTYNAYVYEFYGFGL